MPTKIFLYGSIDLTAICPNLTEVSHLDPKFQEYANKSQRNSHIYLSVNVSDFREPGMYGDTHGIQCSARGKERVSLGKLKEFVRDGGGQSSQNAHPQQNYGQQQSYNRQEQTTTRKTNDMDDMPF